MKKLKLIKLNSDNFGSISSNMSTYMPLIDLLMDVAITPIG